MIAIQQLHQVPSCEAVVGSCGRVVTALHFDPATAQRFLERSGTRLASIAPDIPSQTHQQSNTLEDQQGSIFLRKRKHGLLLQKWKSDHLEQ